MAASERHRQPNTELPTGPRRRIHVHFCVRFCQSQTAKWNAYINEFFFSLTQQVCNSDRRELKAPPLHPPLPAPLLSMHFIHLKSHMYRCKPAPVGERSSFMCDTRTTEWRALLGQLKKEGCQLSFHLPYLTCNPPRALSEVIRSSVLSCTFPVRMKVAITNPI